MRMMFCDGRNHRRDRRAVRGDRPQSPSCAHRRTPGRHCTPSGPPPRCTPRTRAARTQEAAVGRREQAGGHHGAPSYCPRAMRRHEGQMEARMAGPPPTESSSPASRTDRTWARRYRTDMPVGRPGSTSIPNRTCPPPYFLPRRPQETTHSTTCGSRWRAGPAVRLAIRCTGCPVAQGMRSMSAQRWRSREAL